MSNEPSCLEERSKKVGDLGELPTVELFHLKWHFLFILYIPIYVTGERIQEMSAALANSWRYTSLKSFIQHSIQLITLFFLIYFLL